MSSVLPYRNGDLYAKRTFGGSDSICLALGKPVITTQG